MKYNPDLKYEIDPKRIFWELDWGKYKNEDGSQTYPNKPEKELNFEEEFGLAHLLINGVIFVTNHWWEDDWCEEAKKTTGLFVNCNDLFAWGCSDDEEIEVKELRQLYDLWIDDPIYGSDIWCILKRKQEPQEPIFDRIQENTKYDLTKLSLDEDLTFEERLKRITK
jgi:hypothetical protein